MATLHESKTRIEEVLVEANLDGIAEISRHGNNRGTDYSKASVEQVEEA